MNYEDGKTKVDVYDAIMYSKAIFKVMLDRGYSIFMYKETVMDSEDGDLDDFPIIICKDGKFAMVNTAGLFDGVVSVMVPIGSKAGLSRFMGSHSTNQIANVLAERWYRAAGPEVHVPKWPSQYVAYSDLDVGDPGLFDQIESLIQPPWSDPTAETLKNGGHTWS